MTKPYYTWIATLVDLSTIQQYKNGEEISLYSSVEDAIASGTLIKFRIEADDGEYYEVDLTTGRIDCNGHITESIVLLPSQKAELVYARRNQIDYIVDGDEITNQIIDKRCIHRIGLKYKELFLIVEALPVSNKSSRKIVIKNNDGTKDITLLTPN